MNQDERRRLLLQGLLDERRSWMGDDSADDASGISIPNDPDQQRILLRALMNVREPYPVDERLLRIQDDYLHAETAVKGITDIADLTPIRTVPSAGTQTELYLWQGDITTLRCDAIVNAANSGMTGCYAPNHRCIDNAIHTYAGMELRLACAELMERQGYPEPTGQAKISPAFNLPCRYVLHTIGPILESVVFCCISTGEFHFPNERSAAIAIHTVEEFTAERTSVRKVVFNVFKDTDYEIYERLLRTERSADRPTG